MTEKDRIDVRISKVRARLNEISALEGDALTEEIRSEAASLTTEYADLEVRFQAATVGTAPPIETRTEEPLAKLLGLAAWRSPQFSW